LNWKFHQGNVRLAQVRFIAERVKELAPVRGPQLPPVLMGDFNAEPEAGRDPFFARPARGRESECVLRRCLALRR
jgi:endonuclease/exonuclease/phosphatase family metal-dependent hydrolase